MNELKHRIEAIQANAEWLAENDVTENSMEAAKRIGLIKGDCDGIIQLLDEERVDK